MSPLDKTLRRALAILLPMIAACADTDVALNSPAPYEHGSDAGTRPGVVPPSSLSTLLEDFNNLDLIERTSGVIHDVNQGVVLLPTTQFPQMMGTTLEQYDYPADRNGVIAAEQIVIMPMGEIHASDSVELIASNLVRVTGSIFAGQGGVTVAAGHNVIIDGLIQSEGPIRILVSDPMGSIEVSGTLLAYTDLARDIPASITMQGRGRIDVTGNVHTDATNGLLSGEISLYSYSDIRLGPGSVHGEVSSGAERGGASGAIKIRSESRVELLNNARIGESAMVSDPLDPSGAVLAAAGDIEIQAPEVELFEDSTIMGPTALEARGGSILITAGRTLVTRRSSKVIGGTGIDGGAVVIHAATAELGEASTIDAGAGFGVPGDLRIEASTSLSLAPGTHLSGGDGLCANGSDTTIYVAGDLTLATESMITGGAGGVTRDPMTMPCTLQGYRGGDVKVIAHRVKGDQSGIRAGGGVFQAEAHVTINEDYEVPAPNLVVSATGWVESKVVDRGDAAVGQLPVLKRFWKKEMPEGTESILELAGSAAIDEKLEQWIAIEGVDAAALEPLRGARFFRYRLTLTGRVFDTPVIDLFEIDLNPMHVR